MSGDTHDAHEIELEDTHAGHGHGAKKTGDGIGVLLPIVVLVLIIGGVVAGSYLLDEGEPVPPSDPMALIASAPEAVEEAESAHMTMSMEMEEGVGDEEVSGIFDEMSMSAEGDVDYTNGDASIEMSFFGMTMEMRIVDDTMYQRMPAMMRPQGISEEWIGVPVEEAGAAGLNPLGATPNGADMVEMLRGVSGEFEELGLAEVNGVDAWGYRATLDLAEAMEEMSSEERIEANISGGMLGSLGMDEVPLEVWITDDGLPVRMVMELEQAGLFAMTMQIDFTDFGTPVSIEAPPADDVHQVEDLDELEELFGESVEVSEEISSEIELDYSS